MTDKERDALIQNLMPKQQRTDVTPVGYIFWALLIQLVWCLTLHLWIGAVGFGALVVLLIFLSN